MEQKKVIKMDKKQLNEFVSKVLDKYNKEKINEESKPKAPKVIKINESKLVKFIESLIETPSNKTVTESKYQKMIQEFEDEIDSDSEFTDMGTEGMKYEMDDMMEMDNMMEMGDSCGPKKNYEVVSEMPEFGSGELMDNGLVRMFMKLLDSGKVKAYDLEKAAQEASKLEKAKRAKAMRQSRGDFR